MLTWLGSSLVRMILLISLGMLQLHLWFSDSGYSMYRKIHGKIQAVEMENRHAEQDNEKLKKAVDNLKQDGNLLSSNAREHLGMIGPEETLFHVAPEKK